MKNKFILPLVVLGSSVFGQFNVSGQIENYANKPVLVKIFENAEMKLINNAITDNNGNFSVKVPKAYNGFVRIDLPTGENISLLTDNKNIQFKTIAGQDYLNQLTIIEGETQKQFSKVLELQPLNDIQKQVFPYLMQAYKPTDEFYNAMIKEQNRIQVLEDQTKFSGLVKYEKELIDLKQEALTAKNTQVLTKLMDRFVKDDDRLEQSGLFSELVYAYINQSLSVSNNSNVEKELIRLTEELLERTDIQTSRGQNILTAVLAFVPETEYRAFHKMFSDKVKGLTCTITDNLKKQVDKSTGSQLGARVPNIVFDKAVKGKKSLYEIKSKQKLIVFWASWCPACNQELPYIKEFYKDFKAKGGEIVAISLDFNESDFQKAIQGLEWYNYSDLLRWDSPIAESFGITSTPTIMLLDQENKLIQTVHHISELNIK